MVRPSANYQFSGCCIDHCHRQYLRSSSSSSSSCSRVCRRRHSKFGFITGTVDSDKFVTISRRRNSHFRFSVLFTRVYPKKHMSVTKDFWLDNNSIRPKQGRLIAHESVVSENHQPSYCSSTSKKTSKESTVRVLTRVCSLYFNHENII